MIAIRVWRNVPRSFWYGCRGKEVGVRIRGGHWPLDIPVRIEQVCLKIVRAFLLAPPYEQPDQERDHCNATDHPADDRTCVDTGGAVIVIGVDDGNSCLDDFCGGDQVSIGICCCSGCNIRR